MVAMQNHHSRSSGIGGGGIWRCSRFRKAITAMTHAVQVGSMSTTGKISATNVGSSSR